MFSSILEMFQYFILLTFRTQIQALKEKVVFCHPSIKNFTNLGRSFKTPYFLEIGDSKDFTFTPVYYAEENPVFLGEYRQKNKNSELYVDTYHFGVNKKLNKKID